MVTGWMQYFAEEYALNGSLYHRAYAFALRT